MLVVQASASLRASLCPSSCPLQRAEHHGAAPCASPQGLVPHLPTKENKTHLLKPFSAIYLNVSSVNMLAKRVPNCSSHCSPGVGLKCHLLTCSTSQPAWLSSIIPSLYFVADSIFILAFGEKNPASCYCSRDLLARCNLCSSLPSKARAL